MTNNPNDQTFIAAARENYAIDELEIDDDAKVSYTEDSEGQCGAWVAAWVYVSAEALAESAA